MMGMPALSLEGIFFSMPVRLRILNNLRFFCLLAPIFDELQGIQAPAQPGKPNYFLRAFFVDKCDRLIAARINSNRGVRG